MKFRYGGGTRKERRTALLVNLILFGGLALLMIFSRTCATKQTEGPENESRGRASRQRDAPIKLGHYPLHAPQLMYDSYVVVIRGYAVRFKRVLRSTGTACN